MSLYIMRNNSFQHHQQQHQGSAGGAAPSSSASRSASPATASSASNSKNNAFDALYQNRMAHFKNLAADSLDKSYRASFNNSSSGYRRGMQSYRTFGRHNNNDNGNDGDDDDDDDDDDGSSRGKRVIDPYKERNKLRFRKHLNDARVQNIINKRGGLEKMDKDMSDIDRLRLLQDLKKYADDDFNYNLQRLEDDLAQEEGFIEDEDEEAIEKEAQELALGCMKNNIMNSSVESRHDSGDDELSDDSQFSDEWDTQDSDFFLQLENQLDEQDGTPGNAAGVGSQDERYQLSEQEIYENEMQELQRMEQLELELLTNNLSIKDD